MWLESFTICPRNTPILSDQHPQHEKRLKTLRSYDVLDTTDEADFDDIVALASKICDVPVSLISLVDDDRQWFKARIGFEPSETTLEQSVCAHAVLEESFLEIPDMSADARTSDNPLHTDGPQVNFYAGANLIAPNGLPIGTLCVLDTKPRALSDFQRQALKTLSRQVMTQLELRKRLRAEEALRNEIDHRVKNSLQTIASITRVATRAVNDPKAVEVLDLVVRRIGAVASLHTELMGREGQGIVEAKTYLERVGQLLRDVSPDNVEVIVTSVDDTLDARKASAIGMIVSEFLANSIKHAFPDGQAGKVHISLTKTGYQDWTLDCSDTGVGRAVSGDASAAPAVSGDAALNGQAALHTGLGEMLMASAATQLDGQLVQDSGPSGTTLKVQFQS